MVNPSHVHRAKPVRRLKFPAADSNLPWTGERFLVGRTGEIEFEHYHRYLFAAQFCRGRDVLDIASGEGYGSFLLSQVARNIVGIDIAPAIVAHSNKAYGRKNLKFLEGACSRIPLPNDSFDVVVSFETIEHIREHEEFLSEVCRVLRSDGLLVISTPDQEVYSKPEEPNPFHVLELTKIEFCQLLARYFSRVAIGEQKTTAGSVILPNQPQPVKMQIFHRLNAGTFEDSQGMPAAPFLIGVASNAELPVVQWGILDDSSFLPGLRDEMTIAAKRLDDEVRRHQSGVNQLVEQVQEREQRLSAADQELRKLLGEVQDRDERLVAADRELRGLLAELEGRDQRLRIADQNLRRLVGQVEQRNRRLSEADVELRRLGGEVDERNQQLVAADIELRRLIGEGEHHNRHLSDADRDLRRLRSEVEDREQHLTGADGELRRLMGEVEDRERRLTGADGELRRLMGEVEDRERRLTGADGELRRLMGEVEDRERRLTGADSDLRRLMGEVEDRERRLTGADSDLRRLRGEIEDRDQRLDVSYNKQRQLAGELEKCEGRLAAAEGDLRGLATEAEDRAQRLAAVEQRLEGIEASRSWRVISAIQRLVRGKT